MSFVDNVKMCLLINKLTSSHDIVVTYKVIGQQI